MWADGTTDELSAKLKINLLGKSYGSVEEGEIMGLLRAGDERETQTGGVQLHCTKKPAIGEGYFRPYRSERDFYMERRDVLKLLASAAVLPALSLDAVAFLQSVHAQVAAAPGLKTLSPQQDATVTAIAELIIPQTDTAGAKAMKVNEFIDLILTDWYDEVTTKRFLAGLSDVDRRSKKLYGKKFVACNEAQQMELLKVLDAEAMIARKEEAGSSSTALAPLNFFGMIKKLTLIGYYTSEAGFKDELHRTIIPASHSGCAPISGVA
jgi:hypothetical protein